MAQAADFSDQKERKDAWAQLKTLKAETKADPSCKRTFLTECDSGQVYTVCNITVEKRDTIFWQILGCKELVHWIDYFMGKKISFCYKTWIVWVRMTCWGATRAERKNN